MNRKSLMWRLMEKEKSPRKCRKKTPGASRELRRRQISIERASLGQSLPPCVCAQCCVHFNEHCLDLIVRSLVAIWAGQIPEGIPKLTGTQHSTGAQGSEGSVKCNYYARLRGNVIAVRKGTADFDQKLKSRLQGRIDHCVWSILFDNDSC